MAKLVGSIGKSPKTILKQFEDQLSRLTQTQLEQLVVETGIYRPGEGVGAWREELEYVLAEVQWEVFLEAYEKVVGREFLIQA